MEPNNQLNLLFYEKRLSSKESLSSIDYACCLVLYSDFPGNKSRFGSTKKQPIKALRK